MTILSFDHLDHGEGTGMTKAEVTARWPDEYAASLARPKAVCFSGGEPVRAFVERAWEATVAASEAACLTILVTHDAVIRALVCGVLGASLAAMHRARIDLASTTGLRMKAGGVQLDWVNETCHLCPVHERQ